MVADMNNISSFFLGAFLGALIGGVLIIMVALDPVNDGFRSVAKSVNHMADVIQNDLVMLPVSKPQKTE